MYSMYSRGTIGAEGAVKRTGVVQPIWLLVARTTFPAAKNEISNAIAEPRPQSKQNMNSINQCWMQQVVSGRTELTRGTCSLVSGAAMLSKQALLFVAVHMDNR